MRKSTDINMMELYFLYLIKNTLSFVKTSCLSSLFLFSENWLIIFVHVGDFKFNYPYKEKLFEIKIDLPKKINFLEI